MIRQDRGSRVALDPAIERTLNRSVLRAIRPLAWGLAGFYASLATMDFAGLLPDAARPLQYPWTISAVALLVLGLVTGRASFRPSWSHSAFAIVLALVLANSGVLIRTGANSQLTVVYVLVLLGTAVIVLSTMFYVLVVLTTLATWSVAAWPVYPADAFVMWSVVLAGTSIVGYAAQASRQRTILGLESARGSLQKLANVLNASADAIFSFDLGGKIQTWNPAAQRLYGYSEAEALGMNAERLLPGGPDLATVLEPIRRGQEQRLPETTRRAKDGALLPVSVTLSPLRDSDGEVVGATSVTVDLRPRKELEDQRATALLREAELQAVEHTNRLKSEFINIAAHELFTPLTPIRMRLHELRTLFSTDASKEALATIERNVNRLQSVIEEIIEVARVQGEQVAMRLEPVLLAQIVDQVTDEYAERAAGRKQRLIRHDGGPLEVKADPDRLKDAVTNLVENALRTSPEGGEVTITTERRKDEAVIAVRDSGPAVDAKELNDLLAPFAHTPEQKKQSRPGLGMGLYVSRRIVELHGGRLWAQTDGAGGSTFLIALPLSAASTGP